VQARIIPLPAPNQQVPTEAIAAMARFAILLVAASLVLAQGVFNRQKESVKGFVKALEFKHRLRVCNAYPYSASLDVFRATEKLTDSSMPYKACRDFTSPLQSGDKLEFKVGDATAGTFAVSDLPSNDAVLLLVIHRHDQISTAVSFESHVFANLLNAQVAVIDTYKGAAAGTPRIKDRKLTGKDAARSEELRFSSIVAVNPGLYEVELDGKDGKVESTSELVALNRESYVVLRVGVESKNGHTYPQELVVFPQSSPASLQGGAARYSVLGAILATLISAVAW
jgi:hypothetical protein